MSLSYSVCVFLQLGASNPRSHLDENIFNFVRLSQYMHMSYFKNGVIMAGLRALLGVNDSTVHLG